ncbi:MAG: BREX protein BrxB domain-containing protein, partial [Thermoanaerobaculia bacterium]
ILAYDPRQEYELRRLIRQLCDELDRKGWSVESISLGQLLLDRIEGDEPRLVESTIGAERRLHGRHPGRALNYLKEKIGRYVEGRDGIAADVIRKIGEIADRHPEQADRTVIFLGRMGALYPFFRSSAILKHLDGGTRNLPVVLLYPGERRGPTALSFMGELAADTDYRPRIYS